MIDKAVVVRLTAVLLLEPSYHCNRSSEDTRIFSPNIGSSDADFVNVDHRANGKAGDDLTERVEKA